jgi:hypothetical protein
MFSWSKFYDVAKVVIIQYEDLAKFGYKQEMRLV